MSRGFMQRISLLLSIAILLAFSPLAKADTVVESIAARVNNAIITSSQYEHARQDLKQELEQQDPSTADKAFAEQQKDVLRGLIDRQLLLQRADDLGITGETELIKQLDKLRKDAH